MTLEQIESDTVEGFSSVLDANKLLLVSERYHPVAELVKAVWSRDSTYDLTIVLPHPVSATLREAFDITWLAADLEADGQLEIYKIESPPSTELIASEEIVWPIIRVGQRTSLTRLEDEELAADLWHAYGDVLAEKGRFDLRCSGRSRILSTLEDTFDTEARDSFETAVDIASPFAESSLHPVEVVLLVAAAHDLLQYEIGSCSEDMQIASKATLSRLKLPLVESGLIETTEETQSIGRPRKRLHLGGPLADKTEIADIIESAERHQYS